MSAFGITLRNLRKVYPTQFWHQAASLAANALGRNTVSTQGGVALDDLSLSISKGERVGIIGRNGAGKSTLLQMLAGVTEPTSGTMEVSGHVTAVLTLGIGLREDLTGRENIYLDGEVQGKTRAEMDANIESVISFAELGKFIDLPLRTYSTGMKARLAFAMITQIDPEILLIDETLSVGDAAFATKAAKRIAELCAKGAIVIVVSHGMQSINTLCNRCIWLQDGKLVMDGPPDTVTASYLESVRQADEADLATRFRSLTGEKSLQPGFHLSPIELSSNEQRMSRLASGSPLTITSTFQDPVGKAMGYWILRCIRIDGALVLEQLITPAQFPSKKRIQITYPQFVFAPGIFRLNLQWLDELGSMRAEANAMLEITSEEAVSGGRPVLFWQGRIDCMPREAD